MVRDIVIQHCKVTMLHDVRFLSLLALENESLPNILFKRLFFCLAQYTLEYYTMLFKTICI